MMAAMPPARPTFGAPLPVCHLTRWMDPVTGECRHPAHDTYAGRGHLGAVPIQTACPDPTATRARQRRADRLTGANVSPCYRCLAYRPATRTGCHFTERMDTR